MVASNGTKRGASQKKSEAETHNDKKPEKNSDVEPPKSE